MTRPTNREIADTFETIADLLAIKGENVFRINSYRNASETIRQLPRDIYAIYQEGTLTELDDIGKTIAAKIEEMLTTGKLEFFERLTAEVPLSLAEMVQINGLGPKKIKRFWDELSIVSVSDLEIAAREGKLRNLSGMGAKSEQKILDGIKALSRRTDRISIGQALPIAIEILEDLLTLPQALKGDLAGSLRRRRATIGDIDILIAAEDSAPIMDTFVNREDVARILGHGSTKSSVELVQGLQVDVRVLIPERYGTALSYFTGSQQHNIRLRELALKQGLSLNEHAFTATDGSEHEILCDTEEKLYETLGLPWIPPELREDRGEIEAAQQGSLPNLIQQSDIRSDLHMHTTWSDGRFSIREMAEHAKAMGYSHIVITDHSQLSAIANGLTAEQLLEQQAEVRAVDAAMGDNFRVLHGVEMDIRADGSMDLPDKCLAQLDFVIASLHFSLRQPREQITERVLNAIKNPHVDMIGHLRGRKIPDREPADLDFDRVFEAAKEYDTVLEINANPARLDIDDPLARRAQEMGIKLAINTDSHHTDSFELIHYGVTTARRGWIESDTVINTWSTERFLAWLSERDNS